ncbi:MAG TPA: phosphotransferase [Dehalococcoidia bacterium]|nr:phosphotransferase [Dehalococcoidia bacterium]
MAEDIFPVQNSTLSEKALTTWIYENYDFQKSVNCIFYRKGLGICDAYRIESGEVTRFLKIFMHGRRTETDVSEEVRLLNYLGENGVSVAMPLMKTDGSYTSELNAPEGKRYAVMYEGVEGDEIGDDENHIRSFGEMVGRFHQCCDDMPGEYRRKNLDLEYLLDSSIEIISPFMQHRTEDLDLIMRIAEYCKELIPALLPKLRPEYGICHGDLYGGDVRFTEDDTAIIFDFDSSGYGWRALDIGVFTGSPDWMDTTDEADRIRMKQQRIFLDGYLKYRFISENELIVMRLSLPIHHIFLMGHFLKYYGIHQGYSFADDEYLEWYMVWFRYWAKENL